MCRERQGQGTVDPALKRAGRGEPALQSKLREIPHHLKDEQAGGVWRAEVRRKSETRPRGDESTGRSLNGLL